MVTAFVLVMSKTGKEKDVLNNLQRLDEVKEASIVFGDYDILVKVDVADIEMLNDLLVTKIRKIGNIASTTTLISV